MTREDAKKAAEVMMAYADGSDIELSNIKDNCLFWEGVTDPMFNWVNCKYRIKPEPKYRPFKNSEECWNEMLKHHPFGWLRAKENKNVALIGNVYMDKEVWIVWTTNERDLYSASEIFNNYVFADGTPFGVKED